jgi:hypothetical protein
MLEAVNRQIREDTETLILGIMILNVYRETVIVICSYELS